MNQLEMLESVLTKDSALLSSVRPEQGTNATDCPDFDVAALSQHMAGWIGLFESAANGEEFKGDPQAPQDDPAEHFRASSERLVEGWRSGGFDREVPMMGGKQPASGVVAMTLIEFVTHGCDLALATEQGVPFTDEELETTLEGAKASIAEDYRGEGKFFGPEISVPEDASALDRLLGFMGRQPASPLGSLE